MTAIVAAALAVGLLGTIPPSDATAIAPWVRAEDLRSPEPLGFAAMPGASSGRSLWFAVEDPEEPRRSRVMHVSTDRDPATVRVAAVLEGEVESIAAWEDRAWIVLAPRSDDRPRREVVTLQTARNPASGLDYSWPREGPRLLPSLPGEGRLLAFSADSDGPVALLWPDRVRSQRVRRGGGEEEGGASLWRLERETSWTRLPDRPGEGLEEWLIVEDAAGPSIAGLSPDPADRDVTVVRPLADPTASRRWDVPFESIVAVCSSEDAVVLALRREFGSIHVCYPRSAAVLDLAVLDAPRGPWLLGATLDGLRLVEQDGDRLMIRSIDPIDGVVSPPRELGAPTFGRGGWLHLPVLGLLVVTAVLALVLFRPLGEEEGSSLPEGWAPLPITRRLLALAVDALPALVVTVVWLDVDVRDLIVLPAWTLEGEAALPSAVAIAGTILWCTTWELLLGATPGKLLVGGRVIDAGGRRPAIVRTLARNLFKAVMLYAPILAIFALLSPGGQGIGEVVSRTFVATRTPPAPGAERS